MSTDLSEGWHSNGLPTAQLVPPAHVFPPVVGGLSGDLISARQRTGEGGGRSRADLPVLRINRLRT